MYRYLVIEDNPGAVALLQVLMADEPDLQPTVVCQDLKEGIRAVLQYKPDLLFLDVELPDFTGFDFIEALRKHLHELPAIIMTTAHEKYALQALNNSVLYYLLKPIDPDELLIGLQRFRAHASSIQKQLTIKTPKGYVLLRPQEVILMESASNYTYFYTIQGEKIVATKTLKEFEQLLTDQFLRVHKSYSINRSYVKMLQVGRKKVHLSVPAPYVLNPTNEALSAIKHLLNEQNELEIPIGEAYFDRVKNSLLYASVG